VAQFALRRAAERALRGEEPMRLRLTVAENAGDRGAGGRMGPSDGDGDDMGGDADGDGYGDEAGEEEEFDEGEGEGEDGPREELRSVERSGGSIVVVSSTGDVLAIDAAGHAFAAKARALELLRREMTFTRDRVNVPLQFAGLRATLRAHGFENRPAERGPADRWSRCKTVERGECGDPACPGVLTIELTLAGDDESEGAGEGEGDGGS
jgi:hypothetical protein